MDTLNQPVTMKHVADAFAMWKTVHDQITQLEKAHKLALTEHSQGSAPFPIGLQDEIALLRVESDRLLLVTQQALLKIKTPRSSRESGDSTLS